MYYKTRNLLAYMMESKGSSESKRNFDDYYKNVDADCIYYFMV